MSAPTYVLDDDTLAFVKRRAEAMKPPPAGTTRDPENEAYNWARRCLDVIAMLEHVRGVQYAPREPNTPAPGHVSNGHCPKCAEILAAPPREPPPLGDELFKRVRRALWTYCQHKSFCHYVEPEYDDDSLVNEGTPCDCGLHAEMEASQQARGRPEGPSAPPPQAVVEIFRILNDDRDAARDEAREARKLAANITVETLTNWMLNVREVTVTYREGLVENPIPHRWLAEKLLAKLRGSRTPEGT